MKEAFLNEKDIAIINPFIADVFSLGIIIMRILMGKLAFSQVSLNENENVVINEIDKLENIKYWQIELISMVRRMLNFDPSARITMDQVLGISRY